MFCHHVPIFYASNVVLTGNETRLSESHLSDIISILKNAAAKWKQIGLNLRFLSSELTIIERKPMLLPEGDTAFFSEMLTQWLKWAPPNHPWPTLEALSSALQNAGEESLAYSLRKLYSGQSGKFVVRTILPKE